MDLLLQHIEHLVTFDDEDRELRDVDVLVRDGRVAAIGADLAARPELGLGPDAAVDVIDGRGLLVTPGLINAHQHLYQVGLRAIPELERAPIRPWLRGVGSRCLLWANQGRFTPEVVGALAAAGLTESLLGGVTTVADQHYFFPAGKTLPYIEHTIEAAAEVGARFHAGRGTLTLGWPEGKAHNGSVQSVDEVLRHAARLLDEFHDPAPDALVRIDLAPCGVHVDRPELFEAFAALAEDHEGVRLHTHLYEQIDTEECVERYGITPWDFLVEHGWAQPRTWIAHVVDPPLSELADFAAAGVSVAHLPAPDLRMGWGFAPVREMLDAGVDVGFGTTGSASNDGANLLGDLRLAALGHRSVIAEPERWLSARELLRMATRGSAACLGRPELGHVSVGAIADLAAWDLHTVDRVGIHDPVVGLLLCGLSSRADLVTVGGRVVVRDGRCVTVDERVIARRARELLGDVTR